MKKLKTFITSHRIWSGIIVAAVLGSGYFLYSKLNSSSSTVPRYVVQRVSRGTVVASVSGSGQVESLHQIDIKPKISGNIVSVGVAAGQTVQEGTFIAQFDTSSAAQNSVKNAELALERDRLTLQRMKGESSGAASLRSSQEIARDNLKKDYDDGFTEVSNTFVDLPDIMNGMQNLLFSYNLNKNEWNIDFYKNEIFAYDSRASQFRDDAYQSYQDARAKYNQSFSDYKSTSRFSSDAAVENLINETYDTSQAVSDAIKSFNNLIRLYEDTLTSLNMSHNSLADTQLSTLNTYISKIGGHLSNLVSAINAIKSDKDALAGTGLDLEAQKLAIKQDEIALANAKENLNDSYILAPISGVIAAVNVSKGDYASPSAVIATIVTRQKLAQITLNEVDAAKVSLGDKATLAFDAIEGLTLAGKVSQIDVIGTVSQGVVNYNLKIGFDTQDDRVKPGMSVTAAIVTDVHQNVLTVLNSAVKSQGQQNYVEIPAAALADSIINASKNGGVVLDTSPKEIPVAIGLVNDSMTEIVSGLNEGDEVIVRTINPSSNSNTTQSSQSNLRIPGGLFGGGR